jgi:hypothetical protein
MQFWLWQGRKVPMNSMLDLFLFIAKDLGADYSVEKERKYRLVHGSLTIDLSIRIRGANIHEVLDIHKTWESLQTEHIVYIMDYEEPTIAEAREKEKMKTEPDGDGWYKVHLKMENRNRYLSNEMYVDNVTILSHPLCKIGYEASRIDRALRSLAHLKFPANKDDKVKDEWFAFPAIYTDIVRKTEWLLESQLGPDRAQWQAALRRGRANIDIVFAKEIKGVMPVWVIGRYIFDLCRLYGKPMVH